MFIIWYTLQLLVDYTAAIAEVRPWPPVWWQPFNLYGVTYESTYNMSLTYRFETRRVITVSGTPYIPIPEIILFF